VNENSAARHANSFEGESVVLAIAARLTAVAAVAVFAGSASAQSTGVGFTLVPKKVVQGEDARVAVSVDRRARAAR
jgi:hypothetical protein